MENNDIPEMFRDLRIINRDEKIVYCKNCTMSNQRPRIQFNEEGICLHAYIIITKIKL